MPFGTILFDALIFLILITLTVTIHELGHFWLARRRSVRVDVFSIGLGRELFGWTARTGTRWKIALLPIGGYVRFSAPIETAATPGARAAILIGGPLANFVLAFCLLAGLYLTAGRAVILPTVDVLEPGSPALAAGMTVGDRVLRIAGVPIGGIEELQRVVQSHLDQPVAVEVERGGQTVTLTVTPRSGEMQDGTGRTRHLVRLGLQSTTMVRIRESAVAAIVDAAREVANQSIGILSGLRRIVLGQQSAGDIGGVIQIAQISGVVAHTGSEATIEFLALLSVNLGLINLLPVPLLDGGQLVFCGLEALRGRPLGRRAEGLVAMAGFFTIGILMLLGNFNDLVHTGFFGTLFGGTR